MLGHRDSGKDLQSLPHVIHSLDSSTCPSPLLVTDDKTTQPNAEYLEKVRAEVQQTGGPALGSVPRSEGWLFSGSSAEALG